MNTLAELRNRLTGRQIQDMKDGRPRFLFRGQRLAYPCMKSTFGRIPATATAEIGQAYTVYRWAMQICQGLNGYTVGHLDGMAVLQHYGWPTPLIDFTGTLEVALSFALDEAPVGSRAVVYCVDSAKLPQDVILVDHDFLTHRLEDGGTLHRWLRQDGFALTTANWQMSDKARDFDLHSSAFESAIERYDLIVPEVDNTKIPDLLSTAGDPIPQQLQSLIRLFSKATFEGALAPGLEKIVERMWNEGME